MLYIYIYIYIMQSGLAPQILGGRPCSESPGGERKRSGVGRRVLRRESSGSGRSIDFATLR